MGDLPPGLQKRADARLRSAIRQARGARNVGNDLEHAVHRHDAELSHLLKLAHESACITERLLSEALAHLLKTRSTP